jgi:hypothetical protein
MAFHPHWKTGDVFQYSLLRGPIGWGNRRKAGSAYVQEVSPPEGFKISDSKFKISAVPLQVEQAQLDTWIDIGRLIVEVGKTL